ELARAHTLGQVLGLDMCSQMHAHLQALEHDPEVTQHLVELVLAGYLAGHVQLASQPITSLEESDRVTALCGIDRERHAGGATANHGKMFMNRASAVIELDLAPGS